MIQQSCPWRSSPFCPRVLKCLGVKKKIKVMSFWRNKTSIYSAGGRGVLHGRARGCADKKNYNYRSRGSARPSAGPCSGQCRLEIVWSLLSGSILVSYTTSCMAVHKVVQELNFFLEHYDPLHRPCKPWGILEEFILFFNLPDLASFLLVSFLILQNIFFYSWN